MASQLTGSQIAVVGLGLMGGSLAGALRGRCKQMIGVARRAETVEAALGRGLVDQGFVGPDGAVNQADLVVLATPVRTIVHQLSEIGEMLRPGCVLMDLGSTKAQILAAMERLPAHVQPLGGHPVCGREQSGLEAADPGLFRGRTFVLTPLSRTRPEAIALGRELAEAVGARPLILEPERHDALVAMTSHMPYLLSCALTSAAQAAAEGDPALWQVAAGGFRDMSRLAGSDVQMMLDILLTNREAVLRAVQGVSWQLDRLAQLVEAGDEAALRRGLAEARATRREVFP